MNLYEMTDLIGVMTDDLGHTKVPLRLLMHSINGTQDMIAQRIEDQEEDLFAVATTITPSSSGVSLPVDFLRVRDLSYNGTPIELIQPAQRHAFEASTATWAGGYSGVYYAYLRGSKIYFASGMSSSCDFVYSRRLPKLHRATVSAATSTTVTLPAEALIGSVETSDDYYNNATIKVLSGTGVGEEHVFSDYVGSTRVGTTDAWTATPTSASVYEIKCELPTSPDFHTLLCEIVASKFGKKKSGDSELRDLDTKLGQLSSRNSQNPMMII